MWACSLMTRTPLERFEEKYIPEPTTGCWLWNAFINPAGYGHFSTNLSGRWKNERAHRASYELFIGPIPDGMCVCHACDTPACVNPDHLFLGTRGDNNTDRGRKGRGRPGKKLTPEVVRFIRRNYGPKGKDGYSQEQLARLLGIGQTAVSFVLRGLTHQNVT